MLRFEFILEFNLFQTMGQLQVKMLKLFGKFQTKRIKPKHTLYMYSVNISVLFSGFVLFLGNNGKDFSSLVLNFLS